MLLIFLTQFNSTITNKSADCYKLFNAVVIDL